MGGASNPRPACGRCFRARRTLRRSQRAPFRTFQEPATAFHIALVGGGNISRTHAAAAQELPDVRVVAVQADRPEKGRPLAESCGAAFYSDLADCLAHRPLDAVVIGSPSGLHAEQAMAAVRRGLHVLVEKPLDVTTARVDALVAAAEAAGVRLAVLFQDRGRPAVRRLKELVDSGGLGRAILVSGRVRWWRPPEYYSGSRWRGRWAFDGGGAVMNQAIHTVDLMLHLLGDVRRVQAASRTAFHRIEVEDTAAAVLEFANGAAGLLEASTAAYPGYPRRLELTGTEGTVILEHDRIVAADLRTPRPDLLSAGGGDATASAASPVVSDASAHRVMLEDFVRSVREGGRPLCDGSEGRRSVAVVEALYRSAREGTAVTLG